jgi:hypothetical protein
LAAGGKHAQMEQLTKLLGLGTPFAYATGIFAFFHWLDGQASEAAKKAVSGWLQPKQFGREAVSLATIEIFDRVYTRPLLGWRALLRSSLITLCATVIFLYEFSLLYAFVYLANERGFLSLNLGILLTNIIADYLALFAVRRLLVQFRARPVVALFIGASAGALMVLLVFCVRTLVFMMTLSLYVTFRLDNFADFAYLFLSYFKSTVAGQTGIPFSIGALLVHLWLPFFALCVGLVQLVTYLRHAAGWTQWFIKQGEQHPLDAIGYVAAVVIFITTSGVLAVRFAIS